MAKKQKKSKKIVQQEADSAYLLKLVLYVILGSQWLWITTSDAATQIPLPLGLVIGLLFARNDHFQIDRKIEYAVILITALLSFWTQIGIFITL